MACLPRIITKHRCLFRLSCHSLQKRILQQQNTLNSSSSTFVRLASTKNSAWQIYEYGDRDVLTFTDTKRVPLIKSPFDVLVKVHAASVNPMDIRMRSGYGSTLINIFRTVKSSLSWASEFPLTLGRDFSGVIVSKGHGVKDFKVGDEVWGTLAGHKQGSHAAYTVAGADEISLKPKTLDHIQSASIPYVAMTTWSAFHKFAQMSETSMPGKRVLVIGGAGGIGTFTIQWLKTLGAHVTSVCSTDGVVMALSLGADDVIDYKTQDVPHEVQKREGFDYVYDPVGGDEVSKYCSLAVKPGGCIISLVSPLLNNTDTWGLPLGLAKSTADLGCSVSESLQKRASFRWAYFVPDGKAMKKVADLVDSGLIKPIVEEVFPLDRLPDAYDKVGKRSGRGKTVIDMKAVTKHEQAETAEMAGAQ